MPPSGDGRTHVSHLLSRPHLDEGALKRWKPDKEAQFSNTSRDLNRVNRGRQRRRTIGDVRLERQSLLEGSSKHARDTPLEAQTIGGEAPRDWVSKFSSWRKDGTGDTVLTGSR